MSAKFGCARLQHLDEYLSYEDLFTKKIERVAGAFDIIRNDQEFLFAHMKQKVFLLSVATLFAAHTFQTTPVFSQVKMDDLFEHQGVFLHFTMMLNYIKAQGTPEQQKLWGAKARNGDFIAAYAQTELGHGSNVRGIETTSTFDPETKE